MSQMIESTRKETTHTLVEPAGALVESATGAGIALPHDTIPQSAYEIYLSEQSGSDIDNWLPAERELLNLEAPRPEEER